MSFNFHSVMMQIFISLSQEYHKTDLSNPYHHNLILNNNVTYVTVLPSM